MRMPPLPSPLVLDHAERLAGLLFVGGDRLLTWSLDDGWSMVVVCCWQLEPAAMLWATAEHVVNIDSPNLLSVGAGCVALSTRQGVVLRDLSTGKRRYEIRPQSIDEEPRLSSLPSFSPDGSRLVVAAADDARGTHLQVFNIESSQLLAEPILRDDELVTALGWLSSDVVLSAQGPEHGLAHRVDVWRATGEKLLATVEAPGCSFFAMSSGGTMLFWQPGSTTAAGVGRCSLWEMGDGAVVEPRMLGSVDEPRTCSWPARPLLSPNGSFAILPGVVPCVDGAEPEASSIRVVLTDGLRDAATVTVQGSLLALAVSRDGHIMAAIYGSPYLSPAQAESGPTLRLWVLPSGEEVASYQLDTPKARVAGLTWAIDFSPCSQRLAVAVGDQVLIWDLDRSAT
jgi:hypothetical protein